MSNQLNTIGSNLLPSQKLLIGNGLERINNVIFLDLLDIASNIYIEDVKTKINSKSNPRCLDVVVPVTDVSAWNEQKLIIEKIANFLSGDKWNVNFTRCVSKLHESQLYFADSEYDNISLLSGGLDSFCGSYVNISNNLKSLYCGYKINTFETKALNNIHDILIDKYHVASKRFNKLEVTKEEHTQRTRSFLFFALACATASMYNIKNIYLYENGVLSLNPELDSRITTKTTHPKTIYLINQLLSNLNIDMHIKHPFLFKTKGEIINDLSDEFKEYIKYTNTCGIARHNRKIKIKTEHCGFCIPCILRKISMAAYENEMYDIEYNAPYGTTLANCDPSFKAEFKSSNEYFIVFNEKIKNGSIFDYLNLRAKYYSEDNYIELTKNLLDRFSKEIDKFYYKYPIE